MTPVERHGSFWFKRDDLFTVAGVCGGKARACWALAQGARGLVTAGSRQSPQCEIVAHIAQHLGIPCRLHMPSGIPEIQTLDAEVIQHKPGYNSVIVKRARDDADYSEFTYIPFGMECKEAVLQTRQQVANLPRDVRRIVVPVGSGMSLAGILWGIQDFSFQCSVLGVIVGADPEKRLDRFAPSGWRSITSLEKAQVDYHTRARETEYMGITLDPIYEAKCIPFLQPDDLLWIVGIRK